MKLQDDEQFLPSNDGEFDAIGVIVEALRIKFGGDAAAVARVQSINASPESAPQWFTIVSRLSA